MRVASDLVCSLRGNALSTLGETTAGEVLRAS